MEWEVPENIEKAQASTEFILKGCKCKGGCSSRRCSCRKKERICGPSCQCVNCSNIPTLEACTTQKDISELETIDLLEEQDQEEEEEEEEYVTDSEDDELDDLRCDRETDEIMRLVFGDDSDDED